MTTREGALPEPSPSPLPSRRRWIEAALVALLALALNLAGNGRISLFDRDEPRFAGCTREMRERGDWVFPTFNGEPRFHKPILIYWLMRGGFAVGGDNPFGARLASALAGTITSLLVLRLGRRMFGPAEGLLAALMLTTAPIMVVESKLATTDATLALFVVMAQLCLWELSRAPSGRYAAGFWIALGLATLTKGPVGPALIAAAGLATRLLGGPTLGWRRLRYRWGMLLCLAIAAPWYVAVGWASRGEFFEFAVGHQMARRMVHGVEQHGGFPGYYLVATLVLFHPWVGFLPAALRDAWSRRRSEPALGFLLGWMLGPLVLLEIVQTKLVHYYLPSYPACALMAAWGASALIREGAEMCRRPLGRWGLHLIGAVGLGLAGFLAVATLAILPGGLRLPGLALAVILGGGTIAALIGLRRAATGRAVAVLAATWALALLTMGAWMLPAAEPYRISRIVGERLARLADATGTKPVLLSFQEPSLVYTMHRPALMMRTWPQFYGVLDRLGVVSTAILDKGELADFRGHGDLDIEIRETIRAFDLNKGKTQVLHLALIRRKALADRVANPARPQ